jgi:hypothetical protein
MDWLYYLHLVERDLLVDELLGEDEVGLEGKLDADGREPVPAQRQDHDQDLNSGGPVGKVRPRK